MYSFSSVFCYSQSGCEHSWENWIRMIDTFTAWNCFFFTFMFRCYCCIEEVRQFEWLHLHHGSISGQQIKALGTWHWEKTSQDYASSCSKAAREQSTSKSWIVIVKLLLLHELCLGYLSNCGIYCEQCTRDMFWLMMQLQKVSGTISIFKVSLRLTIFVHHFVVPSSIHYWFSP